MDRHSKMSRTQDLLTGLNDSIRVRILNFLPTKDAVATSTLSTGWKESWKTVSILDFADDEHTGLNVRNKRSFMEFVDGVLQCHPNSSKVEKFRLSCTDCKASRINGWIKKALSRDIGKLDLKISHEEILNLPHGLFHCPFLTDLKIEAGNMIVFPTSVTLPNLINLHVSRVCFENGNGRSDQSMDDLFVNCPSLSRLELYDCEWDCINTVTIAAPNLQIMGIYDRFRDVDLRVRAENLVRFAYSGDFGQGLTLMNPHVLADVEVDVDMGIERPRIVADRTVGFLRQLPNKTKVTISFDAFMCILRGDMGHFAYIHRELHAKIWNSNLKEFFIHRFWKRKTDDMPDGDFSWIGEVLWR